jgi:hypothetical protein
MFDTSPFLMYVQVSANGNVLRSEIVGSIKMRVFLSGMPELRLGLNDKVLFENTGREFLCTVCHWMGYSSVKRQMHVDFKAVSVWILSLNFRHLAIDA